MSGKGWKLLDITLGLIGGACGLLGIISGVKSSKYDEERQYKELEDRYGLTPISNNEED